MAKKMMKMPCDMNMSECKMPQMDMQNKEHLGHFAKAKFLAKGHNDSGKIPLHSSEESPPSKTEEVLDYLIEGRTLKKAKDRLNAHEAKMEFDSHAADREDMMYNGMLKTEAMKRKAKK